MVETLNLSTLNLSTFSSAQRIESTQQSRGAATKSGEQAIGAQTFRTTERG
jgi:hypothetical protein